MNSTNEQKCSLWISIVIILSMMILVPITLTTTAKIISPPSKNSMAAEQLKFPQQSNKQIVLLTQQKAQNEQFDTLSFYFHLIGGLILIALGLYLRLLVFDGMLLFSGFSSYFSGIIMHWFKFSELSRLAFLWFSIFLICITVYLKISRKFE